MLATASPPEAVHHLDLPTAGRMAYRTFGDPTGPLVVVLDGPASRGLARAAAATADEVGVRLVAPDRPRVPSLADWPALHAALLDDLGAERAGILGQSGGTPYSLAAAAALGDRTTGVALLGALAPSLRDVSKQVRGAVTLARRAPWLLRAVLRATDPRKATAKAVAQLPPVDARIMEDPRLYALNEQATTEVLASGAQLAHEFALIGRPWDIDFGAVRVPVALWSGDRDVVHPTSLSRELADALGGVPVHVMPGAATFGLMAHYGDALRFAAGRRPW